MSDWSGPEPLDSTIHDDGVSATDLSRYPSLPLQSAAASATRITITAAAIGSMSALMLIAGWSQPKAAIGAGDLDLRHREHFNAGRAHATIASIDEEVMSVSAQAERGAVIGLVNADDVAARAEQIALAARRAEWRAEVLALVGLAPGGENGARTTSVGRDGAVRPAPAFSESKWNQLQRQGAAIDAAKSDSNTERVRRGERSGVGAAGERRR